MNQSLSSVEICAGAGGQALGLERAGFNHRAVVEIDPQAAETLRLNRPQWNVHEEDVLEFEIDAFGEDLDLLAGGVPCPPFSIAGKQLGADDERDLFPRAIELTSVASPKAVMLENVRGLAQPRFTAYRHKLISAFEELGYTVFWELLTASEYGVPQLRPRFILVALKHQYAEFFSWPEPSNHTVTVGEALKDLMSENGWPGAESWARQANTVAPTLVGGSKKHGGPDLGPSRAREAWRKLGVKGTSIAEEAPGPDFPTDSMLEMPRLTVKMGAAIQGFPSTWKWAGGKTAAWKQVGNAFPPPVAEAVGSSIAAAIRMQPIDDAHSKAVPYLIEQPLMESL